MKTRISLLFLACVLAPGSASAQQPRPARLDLTVVDSATGRPIENVRIDIAGMRGGMHTEGGGVARIERIPPGGRMLSATRLGYAPRRFLIELGEGESGAMTLAMRAEAVTLSGVTVRGERRDPTLDDRGFYERERRGFGDFLTAEAIDHIRPMRTIELFRRMRGFMVRNDYLGQPQVTIARGAISLTPNHCSPLVYLDGVPSTSRAVNATMALEMVSPETIAAIEAYAGPASIPAEYNPNGSACGVILIWTKSWRA
jgi:hypothetical protein